MVNGAACGGFGLRLCILATLAAAMAPGASALELGLPLACTPGTDCWLVRLVDHDAGPGFADHRCGSLGSDGHEGTDFAIADARRVAQGVRVLASAAGTVVGVRDGMPDQPAEGRIAHPFGDHNCGNGVLLRHAGGWETQYCHLREGSVLVARGDEVAAGQALGKVGMSGEANFPHVHLSVRHDGAGFDPFTGGPAGDPCGSAGAPLWSAGLQAALAYDEAPIAVVGLTDHVPDRDAIVAGNADAPVSADSPALVGYLLAYGLRAGDRLEIEIRGPDARTVSAAGFDLAEDAPRATRAAGRRRLAEGWVLGSYAVEARVRRGERTFSRTAEFPLAQ